MRISYLLTLCLVVQSSFFLHAQEKNDVKYSIHQLDSTAPKNYWIVEPPSKTGESKLNEVRIIVRFNGNLLGSAKNNQRVSARAEIENLHQQFLDDLQKLDQNPSLRTSAPVSKILFDYREVFNGYALVTTDHIKEEIKKLPYVTYVTEDKKVKVSDLESNQVINAPQVWTGLSVTGKGVSIGIIDTGIDYNHPDLGGGFGPGYKVKGGFDFVNNDSNPLDDHGHGTHVAGIAAGNGPGLKGVAPDASLFAYKVLDGYGSGYDSWILAAIERSVDPDQNPNTQDALDVVNMSLGRAVDDTEPLSEAVNNAVARGVIFVIAAGNSYDYVTVGTPGIAERAITVGATNNYDMTAYFSSKGPVQSTFALKPDLAAPGVEIYSTSKNSGYETLSGTSMASPHVAGAAALMLEKHPHWTPDIIKAALMNTAKPSSEIIWNQGAGRIDVYEAITSEFVVTPGSFSLGVPSIDPFEITFKATVHNIGNSTRHFTLSFEGDIIHPSVSASISETAFSLPAKASREVDITFKINTSTLPVLNLPEAITGSLVVETALKTIKSPVTLLNPQKTKVIFEGELPLNVFVFGTEGNHFWKGYFPTSSELDLFLPQGTFDMISLFNDNHTVVIEGIVTEKNITIPVSKGMAKNKITFKPLDQHGNAISFNDVTSGIVIFSGIDKNFLTFYSSAIETLYISDQKAYRYEMMINGTSAFDKEHQYNISASTGYGQTESKVYSNKFSDFKEVNISNPSARDKQGIIHFNRAGNANVYMTSWNHDHVPVQNPLRLLLSETDPNSMILSQFVQLHPPFNTSGYTWETPAFKSSNGNLILEDKIFKSIKVITEPSFNYNLGETLLRFSTRTTNRTDNIVIFDPFNTGNFNRFYGERESGTIYYKLYSAEKLIKEGNLRNSLNMTGGSHSIDASPDLYKMILTYEDYQVQGSFGKATVELDINTSQNDKDAPQLSYLSLDVAGNSVNNFKAGTQATIVAKVEDLCFDSTTWQECISSGISTVHLYVKKKDKEEWVPLSIVETESNEYHASLPVTLTDGFYSLKLTAKDKSNNILTYELNPGFLIGNVKEATPYAKVNLISPVNKAIDSGTNPLFSWSSLPLSEYKFQLSETEDFVFLLVEANTKEESFNLTSTLQENKHYYWRVKATSDGKSLPWSDVNSFYSGTLKSTILLQPKQNAKDEPVNIQFKWAKVDEASSYLFELSPDQNFYWHQMYTYLLDTTIFVENLLPNSDYYWRVTTNYFTWDNQYFITSSTNTFSTLSDMVAEEPVTAIDELETKKGVFNYPNPFITSTHIQFQSDLPGEASLLILDPLGREVNHIKGQFAAGKNTMTWNGDNTMHELLPDGLYYGILRTSKGAHYIKMIIKR